MIAQSIRRRGTVGSIALIVGLLTLAGCQKKTVSLEGRVCASDADCLSGYTCHPERSICVPSVRVACQAGAFCPATLQPGTSCPSEGSFVPCVAAFPSCEAGCFTCEDGAWSACSVSCASCTIYYRDLDGDGHGEGAGQCLCGPTGDYGATLVGDCDDGNPNTWSTCTTCVDADGDGFYGTCDAYSTVQGPDCEDSPTACGTSCHPGLVEVCDGYDNDCDGQADNVAAPDCTTYYRDVDNDGHGDATSSACLCGPTGLMRAAVADDCNDANPNAWTNCTSCVDADGDGRYAGCDAYVSVEQDCDDADADNWSSCATCADADGDGFFAGCDRYQDHKGPDCDDDPLGCGAACYPGAPELCDAVDNDCLAGDERDCVMVPTLVSATPIVGKNVKALALATDGTLYAGTSENGGGYRVAASGASATSVAGLKASPISVVFVDSLGVVWFGYESMTCLGMCNGDFSNNCGPSQVAWSSSPTVTHLCSDGVMDNDHNERSMTEAPDTSVIIGTADDFTLYDRSQSVPAIACDFDVPPGGSANACLAMAYDEDTVGTRGMMLGTNDGLYGCTYSISYVSDPPTCARDCGANFSSVFPLSGDAVDAITFDNGGTALASADDVMWLGSNGQGIAVVDYRDSAVYTLMDDTAVSSAMASRLVTALAYDRLDRRLYIGTSNGGLMRVDVTHNAAATVPVWSLSSWSYLSTPALPTANVQALAIDAAARVLWIGTAAGLVRVPLGPVT